MVYLHWIDAHVDIIHIGDVPYQLLKVVGEGSFGVVILGRDMLTREIFAIKIIMLPGDLSNDAKETFFRRVALEISALNQFKYHPNVIRLRCSKFGLLDKGIYAFFLVMEYCEIDFRKYLNRKLRRKQKAEKRKKKKKQVTLEINSEEAKVQILDDYVDNVKKKTFLEEEEIQYWLRQIVDAMFEFYKFNFMHRDLKFENLLLKKSTKVEKIEKKKKILEKKDLKKVEKNNFQTARMQNLLSMSFTKPIQKVEKSLYEGAEKISIKMSSVQSSGETTSSGSSGSDSLSSSEEVIVEEITMKKILAERKKKAEEKRRVEAEKEGLRAREEEKEARESTLYKRYSLRFCDFGLAKRLNTSNPMTATVCGSPISMSPEIIVNSAYSYESDIWGLGVLVLEFITGEQTTIYKNLNRAEYKKNKKKALRKEIMKFDVKKELSKYDISIELKDLMVRLLEKEKEWRITFEDLKTHPFILGKNNLIDTKFKTMFETKEIEGILSKNKNCEMVVDRQGDINCGKGDKFGEETIFLNNGIYVMTIFNVKKSEWKCFYLKYDDSTNHEKEKHLVTHFEKNYNDKHVGKKPRTIKFAVREKGCCLKVKMFPSYWSSFRGKILKYRIIIQKKDISKI